jgi:hypothetical protein
VTGERTGLREEARSPFPLPLAPFEHYMLEDDRDSHPMCLWVGLTFSKRLDVDRLCRAISLVQARHPLLHALVRGRLGGRTRDLAWVAAQQPAPPLIQCDRPPSREQIISRIDLAREVGLRLFLSPAAKGSRLIIQVHHACADGRGTLRFLEEVLAAYQYPGESAPRLRTRDIVQLSGRHLYPVGWKRVMRLPMEAWRTAIFFARKPAALAPTATHPSRNLAPHRPPYQTCRLDQALLSGLKQSARSRNATVNDLLVRDGFRCLGDHRANSLAPKDWIRIAVPVDLRGHKADAPTVANATSMLFLDRRASDCGDPGRLLGSVHQEISRLRRRGLTLTLLSSLGLLGSAPGAVRLVLQTGRSQTTAVVSNLGVTFSRQTAAKRLGLEQVDFVPPIRPGTHAAFGIVSYADSLSISLLSDPRVFSSEQQRALLELYCKTVRATAQAIDG